MTFNLVGSIQLAVNSHKTATKQKDNRLINVMLNELALRADEVKHIKKQLV
jgi:hypothetical protein